MPSPASLRDRFYQLVALGSLGAATFHGLSAAGVLVGDGSPTWRHLLFAGIDTLGAWLLLRRPRWLVFPMALLTAQQFQSHGSRIVTWWNRDRSLDWISIILLIALSATVALLWRERADARATYANPERP